MRLLDRILIRPSASPCIPGLLIASLLPVVHSSRMNFIFYLLAFDLPNISSRFAAALSRIESST